MSFEVSLSSDVISILIHNLDTQETVITPLNIYDWLSLGSRTVSFSDVRSLFFFPTTSTLVTIDKQLFVVPFRRPESSQHSSQTAETAPPNSDV